VDTKVSAAYPTSQLILNIGRETTVHEVVKIEGVDQPTQRRFGLNLTAPRVNAHQLCRDVFGAPTYDETLKGFVEWLKERGDWTEEDQQRFDSHSWGKR
jgi:hypothetical protein